MTLLELNVNLDRVAVALERIAGVLERAVGPVALEEVVTAPAGLEALHRVGRATSPLTEDESWRVYGPARRQSYGDASGGKGPYD